MNQNIVTYLQENKEKFSKDVLCEQLLKTGYAQQEILEASGFVYGESVQANVQANFWDFKSKKVYIKASEKRNDLLFGFFAPWLVGVVSSAVPIVGPIASLFFLIFALIYLFNKRRYISYGLLINLIIIPVVIVAILISIFGFNFIL